MVISVAFSPDGRWLACGGAGGTLIVWNAMTAQRLLTLGGHTGDVHSVAFSPDGKRLASASEDGTVKVWDADNGQEPISLVGHTGGVTDVAFSPNGRLASASVDGTVKVWDVGTRQATLTLKGLTGSLKSVAFSPNGRRIVSCDDDQTVKVWDAQTGQEIRTVVGYTSVAFSPDGKWLGSVCPDGTLRIWDVETGRETLTLMGKCEWGSSVAFSPNGTRVASASDDHEGYAVKLWDTETRQEILILKGLTNGVRSLAFSPGGRQLASADADHAVKVWDAETGQETLTLEGHTGLVTSVVFSPDGRRLASSGLDGMVKVWDAKTGQETLTLRGDGSVAFSSDGKWIATTDHATVKVWDARPLPNEPLFTETVDARQLGGTVSLRPRDRGFFIITGWNTEGAAAYFRESTRLRPDNYRTRYLYVLHLLAVGDRDALRRECSALLERFRKTTEPAVAYIVAWSCVLAPDSVGDPEVPVRLAELASKSLPAEHKHLALNSLVAAMYRAGRFQDVLLRLQEGLPIRNGESTPQQSVFLAMAHHRLGHRVEARRWLDWLQKRQPSTDPDRFWNELEIRLLRSEAEAVILYNPVFPADPFAH